MKDGALLRFLSAFLFLCGLSTVRGFDPNFCLHRAVVSLLKDGIGPVSFGFVEFCETGEKDGPVFMQLNIRGLSPGLHGMHIHEIGDTRQGCNAAGAHFNPFGKKHGDGLDKNRHLGDLGNIKVNSNGEARYQLDDRLISLSDMYNIMGRTLVIHEKPDDLGRGGNMESLKTGNSGRRIACGVIELVDGSLSPRKLSARGLSSDFAYSLRPRSNILKTRLK